MSEIKVQKHVPRDKVHVQRRQVRPTKQTEHVERNENGRIRVETVVEEFAQRSTGARSASLLAVDAICAFQLSNIYTSI